MTKFDATHCSACKLGTCGNKRVGLAGKGNPEAELWFIVDRPGRMEDSYGVSFVNDSSKLLQSIITKVGIPESEYYLVYAVKCFQADKKDIALTKESFATCSNEWLFKEIEEYKPKVVVALGNEVLNILLNKNGILKNRGVFENKTIGNHYFKVMPTLSTSFLQNDNRHLEPQVTSDIKRAYAAVKGEIPSFHTDKLKDLDYKIVKTKDTLQTMVDEIIKNKFVAVDIEARGKDPYKIERERPGCPLVSIQFSTKEKSGWFVPIAHNDFMDGKHNPNGAYWRELNYEFLIEKMKEIFENENVFIIGHNFKFDSKFIYEYLKIKPKISFDTMIAHGLFEETSNSLKKIAWEMTDLGGYEEEQSRYTDTLPVSEQYDMFYYPLEQLAQYGCADVDVTFRIFKQLDAKLRKDPEALRLFKMIMKVSRAFLDIEHEGMKIDDIYLKELAVDLDLEINKIEEEIKHDAFKEIHEIEVELLKDAIGKSGKVLKNKPTEFNISSNEDICNLFFNKLNIPINEKYKSFKTGKPSVGRAVLNALKADYPIAGKLLRHRIISKQKSGFVDAYPQFLDYNNRIHPDYRLIKYYDDGENKETGTATGRLSCSNPNVQQIPSRGDGKKIKRMFLPDYPEHWVTDFDYSGIELRIMAMHCLDPKMKAFFNTGKGDFHKFVAAKINHIKEEEVTDTQRTYAKTATFAILYGAGPGKVAETTGMTVDQAKAFIIDYFKLFPTLKNWISQQKMFAQKNLLVKSLFGRKRLLPDANSRNEGARERALRQAVNSVIQSDASDLTLYSLTRIHSYLDNFNHFDKAKPSRLRGSVHDSILLSVHDHDLEEIIKHIKFEILEKPALDFIEKRGILLKSDVSIGKNWGEQEDITFE